MTDNETVNTLNLQSAINDYCRFTDTWVDGTDPDHKINMNSITDALKYTLIKRDEFKYAIEKHQKDISDLEQRISALQNQVKQVCLELERSEEELSSHEENTGILLNAIKSGEYYG